MHRGYIKLWRKSVENPLYFSEPFTKWQAWVDLLLLTNHHDNYANFRGVNVLVKRGVCAVSEQYLAERWRWKTRGKVSRFLNLLEINQQIKQQKTNVITLVSIANYEAHSANNAADQAASEQQVNSKWTASEQQTDTPKNGENVQNGENEKNKQLPRNPSEKQLFEAYGQDKRSVWLWFVGNCNHVTADNFPFEMFLELDRSFRHAHAFTAFPEIVRSMSTAVIDNPRRVGGYVRKIWETIDFNESKKQGGN